jgi:hypothetical protein
MQHMQRRTRCTRRHRVSLRGHSNTVAHSAERTCLVPHAGRSLQATGRRMRTRACWWMAFTTMHPPSEQPHTNSGTFAKPATSHVARDLQTPALVQHSARQICA